MKQLSEAGREELRALDADVAKMMGWRDVSAQYRSRDSQWFVPSGISPATTKREQIPCYSSSIEAAWTIVEEMERRGFDAILYVCSDGNRAAFRHCEATEHACALTVDPREGGMPLAICKASLKAAAAEAGETR